MGYKLHTLNLCAFFIVKSEYYVHSEWQSRKTMMPRYHNVIHQPLVEKEKITLLPLQIKLGRMKQMIKALKQTKQCF